MSSLPKSFSLDAYSTAAQPRSPSFFGKPIASSSKKKIVPFIIAVCGGTASGKTSVCMRIQEEFQKDGKVVLLSQDCFYKNLSAEQKANAAQYNFDHPDAIDWEYNEEILRDLKDGKDVEVPQYDFKTHSRLPTTDRISGATIIIFEGILIFSFPALLKYMDMKIFVDTDADIRLSRRILRDINERGRDLNGILYQYETFVKPSFETYIQPNKKYADVIIPRGADNLVAINLLIQHIHAKLHELEGRALMAPAPVVTSSPIRKQIAKQQQTNSEGKGDGSIANKWGPPESNGSDSTASTAAIATTAPATAQPTNS